MSSQVHVLGGAQTDFQRNWTKEGKDFVSMFREIVTDGFQSVGLPLSEVERLNKENRVAVNVGNFDAEQYANQGHLGTFLTEVDPAFYGVPGARYEAACASGSVALDNAAARIRSGDYDLVIVLGIEVMKTVDSATGGDFLGTAAYYEKEAKGKEFPFPKLFGQLADKIVERYGQRGVSEDKIMDALAEISTINYANAKLNPRAQTRSWYMSGKHARARGTKTNMSVGGRLCITDCSQVTDGAAIVFLASDKYLEEFKKKNPNQKTAQVTGWGHRNAPLLFTKKMDESEGQEYLLPWTKQAVDDAYRRAGVSVDQVDVFETHDCFTSSEYAAVSAFGISKPGEEHIAIEKGDIALNGRKPINPSGGLIGAGHPVGASGARMMLDIYKQVTDQAGGYQVGGAKTGLMLNIGGSATTNYVFVVKG